MPVLLKYSLLSLAVAGLLAAQHGAGGHSGGGGGSRGSGGSASHATPPAGFSGGGGGSRGSGGYASHAAPPAGFSGINNPRVTYPTPLGLQPSHSGFTGINRGAYNNSIHYGPTRYGSNPGINRIIRRPAPYGAYGFVYPAVGFGYGYGDGFYDPYPYYDSAPAVPYVQVPQYDPYAALLDPNVQSGPGYYYPPIPYDVGPPQPPASPSDPPATPIMVILKNGQRLEVQNYAIMNGTFWDFTKQNSRRIPMASIDVAASVKATEEAGGSFPEEPFAINPR